MKFNAEVPFLVDVGPNWLKTVHVCGQYLRQGIVSTSILRNDRFYLLQSKELIQWLDRRLKIKIVFVHKSPVYLKVQLVAVN